MTHVNKTIHIDTSAERAFDCVTTLGNWPEWHPPSLKVSGATDHSLKPGEQVTEEFYVARRRVVGSVHEREAPRQWVIKGQIKGGGSGTVTYILTPHAHGTSFERDLVYTRPNPLLALLDRLVLRRRGGVGGGGPTLETAAGTEGGMKQEQSR